MYDACQKYGTAAAYKWTGDDLADFISLSIYTGLRISDVALFHIDRLQADGEILVRLRRPARTLIHGCPSSFRTASGHVPNSTPFTFGEHRTKDLDVITDVWRRKVNKLRAPLQHLCSYMEDCETLLRRRTVAKD